MKFIKVPVLLFAVLVFSSCVGRGVDQSKLPQPQSDFAISYMERIRAGDYDAAISMTSENVREQLTPQLFSQMSSLFPTGTVYCEVIGYQTRKFFSASITDSGNRTSSSVCSITVEYSGDDGRYAVVSANVDSADVMSVSYINITPTSLSQREVNRFTLKGKSPTHYMILLAALGTVIFSLITFIVCCMTKDLKYKAIFLLTMFIGVGFVTINWTSGEMSALKFFITIPQLYARSASPYSPWQIGFGVPVSALIFWFTRGSLKKKSD